LQLLATAFLTNEQVSRIESITGCQVGFNKTDIHLSLTYPVYRFPEWFRKPMISCVECMPSIYGSIIWWTFNLLQTGLWAWTDKILVAKLVFWVIYIISLSWINKYFYRKTLR